MPSRESGFAVANRAIKVDKLVSAARRAARGRGVTDPARIAQAARSWRDEHWTALEELAQVKHKASALTRKQVIERLEQAAERKSA